MIESFTCHRQYVEWPIAIALQNIRDCSMIGPVLDQLKLVPDDNKASVKFL